MVPFIRRYLAIVSACGFATAVLIYVDSFRGTTMDSIFRWAIFLHIGVFLLLLPMYVIEYSATKRRTFFWKFTGGLPEWTVRSIQVLALFFIFHIPLFLVQSIDSHGWTVAMMPPSEYRSWKGSELRLFATGWIFSYFVLMMYCWLPRKHRGGT